MLDPRDEKLIGLLRLDARESLASLARKLKLSRSTVQDRLNRLEQSGVIKGYRVQLSEAAGRRRIRSFAIISVDPKSTGLITSELVTFHTVDAVYTVSGKFDILVEISTDTTEEMDRTLDRIGDIPGVLKTESSIVLTTKLQR